VLQWLTNTRQALAAAIRRELRDVLRVSAEEAESIVRALDIQMSVSFDRLLKMNDISRQDGS
jgi:hypothetical protein